MEKKKKKSRVHFRDIFNVLLIISVIHEITREHVMMKMFNTTLPFQRINLMEI
jgi:hypothetical protein